MLLAFIIFVILFLILLIAIVAFVRIRALRRDSHPKLDGVMPDIAIGSPRFSKNKSKVQSVMELRAQMFRERARAPPVTRNNSRRGQLRDPENSTGTIQEDFHSIELSPENSEPGSIPSRHNENSNNTSVSLTPIQETTRDQYVTISGLIHIEGRNQMDCVDHCNVVTMPMPPVSGKNNSNTNTRNCYSPGGGRNSSQSIIMTDYNGDL